MDIRFENQVVLITGASSGIGAATAIEFAKSGAFVVINYLHGDAAAQEVVKKIKSMNGGALAIQADVTSPAEVGNMVHQVIEAVGRIDVLVNNAGALIQRIRLEETSIELFDRIIQLNLKSVFLCVMAVLPHMKKQGGGRIINVSSIAARSGGVVGAGHYAAAKAGLLAITKNMAKEFIGHNILVNGVNPGIITTPFHDKFTPPDVRTQFLKGIPMGREGKPEEIAGVILFLASNYASYITGESIEVNGGMLMD